MCCVDFFMSSLKSFKIFGCPLSVFVLWMLTRIIQTHLSLHLELVFVRLSVICLLTHILFFPKNIINTPQELEVPCEWKTGSLNSSFRFPSSLVFDCVSCNNNIPFYFYYSILFQKYSIMDKCLLCIPLILLVIICKLLSFSIYVAILILTIFFRKSIHEPCPVRFYQASDKLIAP